MASPGPAPASSFCTFTSYYNRPPPPPAQDVTPAKRSLLSAGGSYPSLYEYSMSISNQTTTQYLDYLDPNYHYFSVPLPGNLGQDLVGAIKHDCNVTDPFPGNLTYTPQLMSTEPGQPSIPAGTILTFFMTFFLPQSVDKACVERSIASAEHQDVTCVANVSSELPGYQYLTPTEAAPTEAAPTEDVANKPSATGVRYLNFPNLQQG